MANDVVPKTFRALVENADKKFARVRDLPVHAPENAHALQKVFKAYMRVWRYQQENRAALVAAGLNRWEIGEIASRIGQLYFNQYMRTSHPRFLAEAYVFYDAIVTRRYFEGKGKDLVGVRFKELRFYARFLLVCLVINRTDMVRLLADKFRALVDHCKSDFPETNFKEWRLVVQEIVHFMEVDSSFPKTRSLRYSTTFDSHQASRPYVARFHAKKVLKFTDAILTSYHRNEVKFAELTLDTHMMLQCLEWEPGGSLNQKHPVESVYQKHTTESNGNGSVTDHSGASGDIDMNLAAVMTDPTLPPNPRKALLYRPSVTHLLAVMATICEELSPESIMLVYLSASGKVGHSNNSLMEVSGRLRKSSISMVANEPSSSKSQPHSNGKRKSDDYYESYLLLGPRGTGGTNAIYPGDIIPFTRRPLFLIIDSDNSHAFKVLHGAERGEPAALLLSPLRPAFKETNVFYSGHDGSHFTFFLTATLQAFCQMVGLTCFDGETNFLCNIDDFLARGLQHSCFWFSFLMCLSTWTTIVIVYCRHRRCHEAQKKVRTCCILKHKRRFVHVAFWCMLLVAGAADGIDNSTSSIVAVDDSEFDLIGRYLASLTTFDEEPLELVISIDGTIRLLDKPSGEMVWSFPSGESIYSSYLAPFDQNDNSAPIPAFFMDYDEDDWELSAYSRQSFDKKFLGNIDEFFMRTPYKSEDGSVTLGSRRSTIFVLESTTGRLIESYSLPELASTSKRRYKDMSHHDGDTIDVMRTDYELRSRLPNGEIWWSVKIAKVDAFYSCGDLVDDETTPSCHSRRLSVRKQARDSTQIDEPPMNLNGRDYNVQGFIFLVVFGMLTTIFIIYGRRRQCHDALGVIIGSEIARGSNGTIIFEGVYQKRQVAVKRLLKDYAGAANKELQSLTASDAHENIVRLYGIEEDKDFVYLSLELCACNLEELIQGCSKRVTDAFSNLNLWKGNGRPSLQLLMVLRGIVNGLAHLHKLGIVHRDLKPQNILITRELEARISDMGINKQLGDGSSFDCNDTGCGTSGWQAPEQLNKDRQTRAVDVFSLGCILCYCISCGQHPFGERLERDGKILKDDIDISFLDSTSRHLVSLLLSHQPEKRPKAVEVLRHPIFWDAAKRLAFIRGASDRMEDKSLNPTILGDLEKKNSAKHWDRKIDQAIILSVCNSNRRRYKYSRVKDLVRLMRNLSNHYYEQSINVQGLLGSNPEGLDEYFATKFPDLFIGVYNVMASSCGNEPWFHDYFWR